MGKHKDALEELAMRWIMPTERLASGEFADAYFVNLPSRGYIFDMTLDAKVEDNLRKLDGDQGDFFLNAFLYMSIDGGIDLMGEGRVRGIESQDSIMLMDGIGKGQYLLTKCIEFGKLNGDKDKSMMLTCGEIAFMSEFNEGDCTFSVNPLYDIKIMDGRRTFFDLPSRIQNSFSKKELMLSAKNYVMQAVYLTHLSTSNVR